MKKKYWVVFEKFGKFWQKFSRKRGILILAKFFEKENIPIFFWEYSKRCGKTLLKRIWNNYEKVLSSFRDMGQKKKVERPSHPSHPSHLPSIQVGWTPGTPRREIRRLEHSTCKTRHSTCKTRHSTCKTSHSTCKTSHSTCKTRHSTCKTRHCTCKTRLNTERLVKEILCKFYEENPI